MNKKTRKINEFFSLVKNEATNEGDLYIYGDITSVKWWDEDVTPLEIRNALDTLGEIKTLNVRINSYGGEVFAGNAIVNIINTYKSKKSVLVNGYNDGICASMATGILSGCCDYVYMADNALYMVHKPLTYTYGNANDLAKAIELLDSVEKTLVANYMKKFNGTEEQLRELLVNETWLDAEQAKEWGFVDYINSGTEIVAKAENSILINGKEFTNEKVREKFINKANQINKNDKGEQKPMTLVYNEKLGKIGVTKEMFDSVDFTAENAMEQFANIIPKPVEKTDEFISKETVINALGITEGEEITAEEVINLAKLGKTPPKVENEALTEKAEMYDKLVEAKREEVLKNAFKAEGDLHNAERTKKFLNILDFNELSEQNETYIKQAQAKLNAGVSIYDQSANLKPTANEEHINKSDYDL